MCWTDRKAVEQILKLRDEFNISTFLETGAFMGTNARFHSHNFKKVLSCDIKEEYLEIARKKTKKLDNVFIEKKSSPDFIKDFIKDYKKAKRNDIVLMYLDAHFYDPTLPKKDKWVVQNELKSLKGFENCVIFMHDFDNGLGHCNYEGEHLGMNIVGDLLKKVNPNFSYYTNDLATCDIIKRKDIKNIEGLFPDKPTVTTLRYAWSEPRLAYRGILYCTPKSLDLKKYDLREFT